MSARAMNVNNLTWSSSVRELVFYCGDQFLLLDTLVALPNK